VNRKGFWAGLFGLVAQENGFTVEDFKRRAKKVLDKAIWTTLEAEQSVYQAREALARAETAEMKATTAYTCSLEAVKILAQEVREATEGRPVSAIVFDEFLRQASEGQHGGCEIEEPAFLNRPSSRKGGPRSETQALGVSLPHAGG
jgi:hypothetical protein